MTSTQVEMFSRIDIPEKCRCFSKVCERVPMGYWMQKGFSGVWTCLGPKTASPGRYGDHMGVRRLVYVDSNIY